MAGVRSLEIVTMGKSLLSDTWCHVPRLAFPSRLVRSRPECIGRLGPDAQGGRQWGSSRSFRYEEGASDPSPLAWGVPFPVLLT